MHIVYKKLTWTLNIIFVQVYPCQKHLQILEIGVEMFCTFQCQGIFIYFSVIDIWFPTPFRDSVSSFEIQRFTAAIFAIQMCIREGDIGGYPIPQYCEKNWQIPKYRVENRRNTDTAFMIGHAYLTLYPSRVVYLRHVFTRNQPQPSWENMRRSRIDRYNDRKRPGYWMSY